MEYKISDDNTKLWKLVEKTDEKFLKNVELGKRKFKSIDPHYQMLQATKVFGSFGSKWGVKEESFKLNKVGSKTIKDTTADIVMCDYQATLYYPEGEFPIHSTVKVSYITKSGYHTYDDEYTKKVATNALSKGLSKLGFNADVFMGAFDGDKYNYDGIDNTGIQDEATPNQLQEIINLKTTLDLQPNQLQWVDTMVKKGLNSKQADMVISRMKGGN